MPLTSDESKVFSKENKSIIYKAGNEKAILFIHGYPTTPHMYKEVAKYSSENGFDVYAPLIPTFGSCLEDFTKTNFSSWFGFIENYYSKLRREYKKLYVVGVSMGGAMALKIAEVETEFNKPDGIAVLSAPVVYNSIKDHVVTNPASTLLRIIKIFKKSINGRCVTYIANENDGAEYWHGYRGLFPSQALSLIYNLKEIRKNLDKVDVPVIAIHDLTDKTVKYKNHKIIEKEIRSKNTKFITTEMDSSSINSHHSLLMYNSTAIPLMKQIISFFLSI